MDRVEDTNQNVIAYYYTQETGYYKPLNGFATPTIQSYVRAGNVARIEYGRRVNNTNTPTRVLFNTEQRCEGACVFYSNYPDTPGDLNCTASVCTQKTATFWSQIRLNTIQTQYSNTVTSQWVTVSTTDLDYEFPTPPLDAEGDVSDKKLWLKQIIQKDGANANPLPATQYGYSMLKNRRDAEGTGGAGVSALFMPRLNQINLPLGGVVRFVYGQSHPCVPPFQAPPYDQYPFDCHPGWNPTLNGFSLWNTWKVLNQVMSDTFSLNDTQTLTYTYSTPTNHYDDDPVAPVGVKTYSDFRGSHIVTVIDDSGAKTEYRFYRGMHGDAKSTGTQIPISVPIAQSDGTPHGNDENWLSGKLLEARRLTSGNAARSRTVNWYTSTQTAAATPPRTSAYFVGTSKVETTAYGTANKTTRVEYAYDSYGNVITEKLYGNIDIPDDDRNIQRLFLVNTTANIVNKPHWEKLWAGLTPGVVNAEKSMTEYGYDSQGIASPPTIGNLTIQQLWIERTPVASATNVQTTYDVYGRPTVVRDYYNQTTTTAYHIAFQKKKKESKK